MKKLFFILLILIFYGCSMANGYVVDKYKHYDSTINLECFYMIF